MSSYKEFVSMHFHDARFKGMQPKSVISEIAKMWRAKKGMGGSVTAGKLKGGSTTAGSLTAGKLKGGSTMGGSVTAGKLKRSKRGGDLDPNGAGFFGDLASGLGHLLPF